MMLLLPDLQAFLHLLGADFDNAKALHSETVIIY